MEGVEKLKEKLQYKKLETRKLNKDQNIVTKQKDLFNYNNYNDIGLMINPRIKYRIL